jgi:hypothetical protein
VTSLTLRGWDSHTRQQPNKPSAFDPPFRLMSQPSRNRDTHAAE